MPETYISAQQFWDYYFRNAFLTLERKNGQYTGHIFADSENGSSKVLMNERIQTSVEIGSAALHHYDFMHDDRFALMQKRPIDPSEAFSAVIQKTYPYREAAPFGKQRMSELFSEIHLIGYQSHAPITISNFEQIVINIVADYKDSDNQKLAALAWFLGEQRQRSSAKSLIAIVSNAAFVSFAQHRIHFTSVDTAFSALWKVNDKRSMGDLLMLMSNSSSSGQRKIAPLFMRLVSTTELLSLDRCDANYFNPEFWESFFSPRTNFTDTEWDQYDTDSLFWEIRFLSALRLSATETIFLRKLANDEVKIVSDTARKKLAEKM